MNYGLNFWIKSCSVLGLLTALTVSAHAKVITTCGESNGYGAYLRNGNLGPQGNFKKDGFRGGKIVFEANRNADTGKTKVDVFL